MSNYSRRWSYQDHYARNKDNSLWTSIRRVVTTFQIEFISSRLIYYSIWEHRIKIGRVALHSSLSIWFEGQSTQEESAVSLHSNFRSGGCDHIYHQREDIDSFKIWENWGSRVNNHWCIANKNIIMTSWNFSDHSVLMVLWNHW